MISRKSFSTAQFFFLIALCACGQRDDPVVYSPVGPVPPAAQRPGDPVRGYRAMVNEPYIRCGLPYEAYRRISGPAAREQLLAGREGRNAELPYHLTSFTTSTGVELVANNCLACHAGYFNNRLIVGLGNEALDFTEDPSLRAEAAGAYVVGEAAAAEWRRWVDVLQATRAYTVTDTIGVNPAVSITLALLAHRDPQMLRWSDRPLMELPPPTPPPTSVPPWWRMKKKHALFYNTEGRGDQARIMMLGALLCAEDRSAVEEIDRYAPDMRAYLASLEPPSWPFAIDRELARHGQEIFGRACASCHGTYGPEGRYPNRVIDLETVGTDPVMARFATDGRADRFIRWVNHSYYGELSHSAPAPGYIAPPLDGVWATAPYLHNGSIPTLEALLDSRKRPAYWTRSFRSDDYDAEALGWNYRELPQGKSAIEDRKERARVYDTTQPGYSKEGHTFGDALTSAERRAVLEYIKTL